MQVVKVNTLNRKGKRKRNRRTVTLRQAGRHASGPSSPSPPATRIELFEGVRPMALRKRKPTSPGRRFQTVSDFSEITKTTPENSLLAPKPSTGGRNSYGRKTARHKGGGHKQQYRIIDFKRTKDGVPAKVAADRVRPQPQLPHRCCCTTYDGEKRYILAPKRREGRRPAAERPGLRDPARQRAAAALHPRRHHRAQRRAEARRRRQDGPLAPARACSSWPRRATSPPCACRAPRCAACRSTAAATVGEVGNAEAELIKIGKAGRNRWKGVRPQTRGVAMNPVDHPHGGGEGKTSGGRHPVSPWGKPEGRTRDKTKPSQKLIVRRRRTRGSRR